MNSQPAKDDPIGVRQGSDEAGFMPIAEEIRHDKFTLRQVERKGEWAIYAQWKAGRVQAYELVHIRIDEPKMIWGKYYPKREVYPSSSKWGEDGFTLLSLEEARERLKELTK